VARRAAKPRDQSDLLIVGGGSAGAAAAIHAARQGATVTLLCPKSERDAGGCEWIGPAGVKSAGQLGVTAKAIEAVKFCGLRLARFDLRQSIDISEAPLSGWIVNRSRWEAGLLELARAAGVTVVAASAIEQVSLAEQEVALQAPGRAAYRGRMLLIAEGHASPTAERLGLLPARTVEGVSAIATADFACGGPAGLTVALGPGKVGLAATILCDGQRARLQVVTREPDTVALRFGEFARSAQAAGLLPARLPEPQVASAPAGGALEMDSHVGKRTLLIGEAGGFVAAFSHEAIFPCLQSGCIAADVALRAIRAAVPQDELAGFGAAWRSDLADYLRMPNTDLSLLLPLVFGNAEMSKRVARAYLLGTAF
jgi:flavin-dependent dehydrogenase